MKTFLFHISSRYFPGYKVIKPFYATVSYQVNEGSVDVLGVALNLDTLKILATSPNLSDEIQAAAENNAMSENLLTPKMSEICA